MNQLSPVVWAEGMHLAPHHFQAQRRYFEETLQLATSYLWFAAYGLAACEWDTEALRNGTVVLIAARGILPDGLLFHAPAADLLPVARAIGDVFPANRDAVTVSLAIPAHRPGGENISADLRERRRYRAEPLTLPDETTGRDDRPVQLARKNLRLHFDTEPAGEDVLLPIARVRRSGTGEYLYDPAYIPPCLQVTACPALMDMLQRLIQLLAEKATVLSRGKQSSSRTDFGSRDIADFWMLHAVNSGLVPLRHFFYTKRGHPEELYRDMARLAGALCTFSVGAHPSDTPPYEHDRLAETFGALERQIRERLETIAPTNCISIALRPGADYFYEGDVTDPRCLGRARWILAIDAALGEADLIARTPQLIKVCSRLFVPELVNRALPGLPLTHLPVPPPAVAARVGTQYFSISQGGPCWDHLVKTRQVGVYIPGDLPEPHAELLVVLDQ